MPDKGFAERLRVFRKKEGLSQLKLAELVNVSFMTIRRWESGDTIPRMNEITDLAKVLNCTETELLNGQPDGKVRVTLSYDINKMKEGEIDMETSGFDLFLGKNGFIGLRGGVMLSAERTIDDVMAEIRKELERGLATQIERGTIQKA